MESCLCFWILQLNMLVFWWTEKEEEKVLIAFEEFRMEDRRETALSANIWFQ